MITSSRQMPIGRSVVPLFRILIAVRRCNPAMHDPVFLPDFANLEPDQMQELRCGKGYVR